MSSVDPDRFIDGNSVKWGLLISTLIGSYFVATWRGFSQFIGNLGAEAGGLALGVGQGIGLLISRTFGIPVSGIEAAAIETIQWLELLGPLAFPIGILVTIGTLELTIRGVSRVV